VEEQKREQRPLPDAADRYRPTVAKHLERSE